jgi:hypothetical protein
MSPWFVPLFLLWHYLKKKTSPVSTGHDTLTRCLAVVNLTLMDLPGLTKNAVGKKALAFVLLHAFPPVVAAGGA